MTTPEHPIRQAVREQPSVELVTLLILTEGLENNPQTNLVKNALGDELVHRYPQIADALDAWSEDLDDERTSTDIIIGALPDDVRAQLPTLVED